MSKRNSTNREDRILNAAEALISQLGYDKTTISDIASEAGVAKGAVYLHWASKDDLFDALLSREMNCLMADTLKRIEADPDGGRLPQMYFHALAALQANPLMRALYSKDSRVLGNYIHQQDNRRYVERFGFSTDFVKYMQSIRLIRADIPSEGLAYLFSVIAYGFTTIQTVIPSASTPPVAEIAEALQKLMANGVANENGSSEAGKQAIRLAVQEMIKQNQNEINKESSETDESRKK
jgi:AcrR family transcriptional regulator